MLCWSLVMILEAGRGLGRSEKTVPFWTRAVWARVRSRMKMAGREPTQRVTIGPYFAWRVWRICSSSKNYFLSHWMLVMIGMCDGPGGVLMDLVLRVEMMPLMSTQRQRETKMMNHVRDLWCVRVL